MNNNSTLDKELLDGFLFGKEKEPSYKIMPSLDDFKSHYKSTSMDSLLQDLQGNKMGNVREVIDDIEAMITERKQLQKEVFSDVDKIMMGMNNFLVTKGEKIDAVKEAELREKLLEIEAFKLNEKINTFRDIAALKKELRERLHEYREQEQNATMLNDLLG
jgi:hypothetical protein